MNDMSDEQIPPRDDDSAASAPPPSGDSAPPPSGDSAPPPPPSDDDAPPPPPPPPGDAPPPPPPPPGPAPRPLLRRDDDKVFAGVAGGLADFVGVDATVVRVAFVILTVFGGIGIPLYLVGWAGLRTPSMPESHAERWFRGAPNPAVLIALAVGFIVLINVAHAGPGDGVGWGLALLFAGWLLFRADNRAVAGGATTAPPPAPPAAESTWPSGGGWHGAGGATAPPAPAPPVWHPAPPRPRSILGRLTFGLILAALGVAALLDQLGAVDLQPEHYPALAMTITGVGLIAGAWVGRAYALVWLGLLLVPVTIAASFAPLPLRGGAGDVTYRPTTLADVDDSYRLGLGELLVDLSAVDFQATTTQVEVSVGLGETTIIVPDDVTVDVSGEMRAGSAELFGTRTAGEPFLADLDDTDEGTGAGRLELTIDHGVGDLTIRRANEES